MTPRNSGQYCTSAGIDIGTHAAKLVVARRQNGELSVTRASSMNIPVNVKDDPNELAKVLCAWLRENCDTICRNFVGTLPSSMVDYETVEIPSMESIDVLDFAEDAISELLGNERCLASHDSWTSAGSATSQTLNLAWTSSDFASRLASGLARGGWRCIALDIPAQTLARVSTLAQKSNGHSVVFDIGAGELSIVFADNANCEYFRNRIRFSTNSAANTLAEAIAISNEAAENLLLYWGVGGVSSNKSTELEKLIAQHLTRWLQQLVYEIRRTLNFLKHRFGAKSNCELLLCGGGANIRGLPELLTTELGTRVRFAGPSVAWSWKSAEPYSPKYAQALSLATYGVAI